MENKKNVQNGNINCVHIIDADESFTTFKVFYQNGKSEIRRAIKDGIVYDYLISIMNSKQEINDDLLREESIEELLFKENEIHQKQTRKLKFAKLQELMFNKTAAHYKGRIVAAALFLVVAIETPFMDEFPQEIERVTAIIVDLLWGILHLPGLLEKVGAKTSKKRAVAIILASIPVVMIDYIIKNI